MILIHFLNFNICSLSKIGKMCSENNSSYSDETGLELGLGLGPSVTKTNKSSTKWCEYGRILTAKDFPNGFITRRFNNICTDENIGSASTSAR